ncbi:MAG: ABC transporter permease [Candidatus Faecivivens sp.]|nr:ABC transporter permease [Oscillospiraceae bacterium]MDY2712901.1 ABC transporter permease [Candidatus Faecivivens sp.]
MTEKKSRRRTFDLSRLTAVPYFVWMALFTIVPLALVVWYAFIDYPDTSFTISNFTGVVKYAKTFVKSINLSLISTVICLLIGFPMGFIMSRMSERGQRTMQLLIMLPMWMSFLLRTYAWMTLLENEGLINKFFSLFGIGPFTMINTRGAIVLGMVYNYLPFMILPLYSVMVKIDRSVIEAAQDLGADAFHVFSRVLLPLSVPGIVTGITMVFVPSVSTFIISRMLGGGSNLLIGDLIEQQFLGSVYNPGVGSAMSLLLMVMILLIMGIINHFDSDEMEGMLV